MHRRLALLAALLIALATTAYAAELAGRWRGVLESPVGSLPVQYTFTTTGTTLTGTIELELGSFPLTNGVARGDSVFFTADIQVVTLSHRGRLVGDTLFLAVNDGTADLPVAKLGRVAGQ
jgi:hypothetical protein